RAWELAQPALQPEALRQPQGALLGSRVAVQHGVQVGVLRQRQVLVEGRLIRYEHEALTARERSGWAPYDLDIAAGRHEADQGPEEGALPRPVGTGQQGEVSGREPEVGIRHDLHATQAHAQARDAEYRVDVLWGHPVSLA